MHEVGITQEVIALAEEHAGGRSGCGDLCSKSASSPACCRTQCGSASICQSAEGTLVAGAVLEIIETPGRGRCRACGSEVALERPFGRCSCGETDLEWLAGDELRVKELELDLTCAKKSKSDGHSSC